MRSWWIGLVAVILIVAAIRPAAADFESYAVVQNDASLRIRNQTVHLFGIFIPGREAQCTTRFRPARCGLNRAAVALDFKIQGFVRCQPRAVRADGSLEAICAVNASPFSPGEDLAAYLLEEGLAIARPEAPFEYHALQEIAQANDRGFWGFQADSFRFRRR